MRSKRKSHRAPSSLPEIRARSRTNTRNCSFSGIERQIFDADHPGVELHRVAMHAPIFRGASFGARIPGRCRRGLTIVARFRDARRKTNCGKTIRVPECEGDMKRRDAGDIRMTEGGKKGGEKKDGKEANDKNEVKERLRADIVVSSFRSCACLNTDGYYRRG